MNLYLLYVAKVLASPKPCKSFAVDKSRWTKGEQTG
jgi:hypothetical protein